MPTEKAAYTLLAQLQIPYERLDHPTITSAKNPPFHLPGDVQPVKNLLLIGKSSQSPYLILLPSEKQLHLAKLALFLEEKRCFFASETKLIEILDVSFGLVSPFALIHDRHRKVTVIIDQALDRNQRLGLHPNSNTTTLFISFKHCLKMLASLGYTPIFTEL